MPPLGARSDAAGRFEQWVLGSQSGGAFALTLERSISMQNGVGPRQAFVCNQEGSTTGAVISDARQKYDAAISSLDLVLIWQRKKKVK